jgi:tol-pal system protein YbgF
MQQHLNVRNGVIGLIFMTVTPFLFAAQNPVVVESREGTSLRPAQATLPYQAPIEDEFADRTSGETQYQVQLLQQEVQELRGLVEELQFQLQQMRTTQNDRYLELDSRVQNLTAQPGSTAGMLPNTGGTVSQTPQELTAGTNDNEAVVKDEKTLYNGAVELIRARQYDLAISQLEAVIAQYPQGQFTANAYYWLGEVHAAKPEPDYDAARQALAQVITFFPDSRKVPDAAFKLGKVYHLTGDCDRAKQLLEQVIADHDGKTVARLAADYLRDRMGSCETP